LIVIDSEFLFRAVTKLVFQLVPETKLEDLIQIDLMYKAGRQKKKWVVENVDCFKPLNIRPKPWLKCGEIFRLVKCSHKAIC